MLILIVALLVLIGIETLVIWIGARRLLELDEILGRIMPTLESYASDLRKLSSGGITQDHPEVLVFHRRNLQTIDQVQDAIDLIRQVRPALPAQPLPKPDLA